MYIHIAFWTHFSVSAIETKCANEMIHNIVEMYAKVIHFKIINKYFNAVYIKRLSVSLHKKPYVTIKKPVYLQFKSFHKLL